MKTLINPIQFLTTDLVERCFEEGVTHFVDKQVTGNGFTTAMGMLRPSLGRINVLVAPNQEVVKGKQKSYNNGGFGHDKNGKKLKVGFVYENNGLRGNVYEFDLILYVADSFYYSYDSLEGKIDKLLIDECHSFYSQTDFRYNLKRAHKVIQGIDDPKTSISFLTASPMLKMPISIKIKNTVLEGRQINLSHNARKSADRAIEKIELGYSVNIYTNEAAVAVRILMGSKTTEFKMIAGDSFKTNLLSKGKFKLNDSSRVKIISTTGFEGWDDLTLRKNAAAFMFMNIGSKHATFLGSNIYQAFGRFRNGSSYDEICVIDSPVGRGNDFISDLDAKLDSFIKSKEPYESEEKKQSKNFEFRHGISRTKCKGIRFHPFLFMEAIEGQLHIEKFAPTKMVHDEKQKIDKLLSVYDQYFKERKIKIKKVNDVVRMTRLTKTTKQHSRIENIVYALKNNSIDGLFYEFFFNKWDIIDKDTPVMTQIRKLVIDYIFELETMISVAKGAGFELKVGIPELLQFYRDFIPANQHLDTSSHMKTFKDMHNDHIKRKEYSKVQAKRKRESFKQNGLIDILKMAKQMVFREKTSSYVVHRDYNTYTKTGMSTIKKTAELLGIDVIEIDIKNCFPRILFGINELKLPETIYDLEGKSRQKAKMLVNSHINDFNYNPKKRIIKKEQKRNSKNKFKKFNFPSRVIEYLMQQKWFEPDYRGDLFNYLSYHEQVIIRQIRKNIETEIRNGYKQYNEMDKFKEDIYIFRRHDSLVFFHNNINLKIECTKDYEYMGQKGWFEKVVKTVNYSSNYTEFTTSQKQLKLKLPKG